MHRWLNLLTLLALFGWGTFPASAVPVTFAAHWAAEEGTLSKAPMALRLEPVDGAAEALALELSVPGEVAVNLPPGTTWRAVPTVAEGWAGSFVFPVAPDAGRRGIPVYPVGTLQGRILKDPGQEIPAAVTVRFTPPPGMGEAPSGSLGCPVDEDGIWRCALPVGTFDLRLGLRGFAPQYQWAETIPPDGETTLPPQRWTPGASLSGTVTTLGTTVAPDQLTVEVRPYAVRPTHEPLDQGRRERMGRKLAVDSRGHFQGTDLPPGEYLVVARAPGFAESVRGPLRLYTAAETVLERSIDLRPPAHLEVVLAPPVEPTGEPWRVELRPIPEPGRSPRALFRGTAGVAGLWSQEDIPEGRYTLTVRSRTAEWLSREVRVEGAAPPLSVEVPLVPVRGALHWSGDPLEVALWFVEVGSQKRARMDLEEGTFDGFLPYEGLWQVVLFEGATQRRFVLPPVEVRASAATGVATVEIEIPDGEIRGRVLDPDGEPLAGVGVTAKPWGTMAAESSTRSDAQGRFVFALLEAGAYLVTADHGDYAMATHQLDLQAGLDAGDVELRFERLRDWTARVTAGGAPVPGSWLSLWPTVPGAFAGRVPEGTTDVRGEVALQVPDRATAFTALVFPPGYAVRIARLPGDAPSAEFPLETTGGTLTLRFPSPVSEGVRSGALPSLIHQGAVVPLSTLARWAAERGIWRPQQGEVSIPMLEAGEYTLCPAGDPPARQRTAAGAPVEDTGCRTGFVPPAGELVLSFL